MLLRLLFTGSRPQRASVLRAIALLLLMAAGAQAQAQVFTVTSITPTNSGGIGPVTSAVTGNTEYSISASAGTVTRISGTGMPINPQGTRALVTVTCTDGATKGSCGANASKSPAATITIQAGSISGRTAALKNFRVAAGTGTPAATQGSGASFTFSLTGPHGTGSTRTFHIGGDFTVADTGDSGTATANYTVTASGAGNPSGSSLGSSFSATATRPLTIETGSTLNFGAVFPPSNGMAATNVKISEVDGSRSFTGGNGGGAGTGTSRATFTAKGESGRTFAVGLGSTTMTLNRTGGGGSLTVNLTRSDTTATLAGGSASLEGQKVIGVGGDFNLPSGTATGTYTGTFTVTVQYN